MPDSHVPTHTLPSSAHLADFHAFYEKVIFNKDGGATLMFKVPADMVEAMIALRRNDGLALNVTVWETRLPDGMAELARAVGLAAPE